MSYQKIQLLAGIEYQLSMAGRLLLIDSTGDAPGVDVSIVVNGTPSKPMLNREAGFRYEGAFEGVILTAPIETEITLFVSFENIAVSANKFEISNPAGRPVPVTFSQQIVPLGSVTIDNPNAGAVPVKSQALTTIVHAVPVAVGIAITPVISDATLRRLSIRNGSETAIIAIGGAGLTLNNAVFVLEPGDIFTDEDAAGAAWFAIADVAGGVVKIQGIK